MNHDADPIDDLEAPDINELISQISEQNLDDLMNPPKLKTIDELVAETERLRARNAERQGLPAPKPIAESEHACDRILDVILAENEKEAALAKVLDEADIARAATVPAPAASTPAVAPLPANATLTELCAHARATGSFSSGSSGFGGTERSSGKTTGKSLTQECAASHPGPRYKSGADAWPEPKREPTVTERCQLFLEGK